MRTVDQLVFTSMERKCVSNIDSEFGGPQFLFSREVNFKSTVVAPTNHQQLIVFDLPLSALVGKFRV